MDTTYPVFAKRQVIFARLLVIVDVVFVADIEGWIGKYEVHGSLLQLRQLFDAVALMNPV
jgi:hypothetical protein